MKRTLTVLMTLALIGSMAFVGFAGTAAAGANHDDGDSGDDLDAAASVTQSQSVSQANVIDQNASQFASQDATGIDIDLDGMDGDGDNGEDGDNGDGTQYKGTAQSCEYPDGAAISNIQFYDTEGDLLVKFEWNGNRFVPEGGDNMGVTITDVEFKENEPNDPNQVSWTSEEPISQVLVKAGQDTCESPGDTSGDSTNDDGTNDDGNNGAEDGIDGIEGSTGNQTVNQIVDQDADASNSNSQNADASASAGDILSVLLG